MIFHVRRAIRNSGLSQRRIAQLIGVSPFRLNRILRRKQQVRPEERQRIARVLGVPVRDLFGRCNRRR